MEEGYDFGRIAYWCAWLLLSAAWVCSGIETLRSIRGKSGKEKRGEKNGR